MFYNVKIKQKETLYLWFFVVNYITYPINYPLQDATRNLLLNLMQHKNLYRLVSKQTECK